MRAREDVHRQVPRFQRSLCPEKSEHIQNANPARRDELATLSFASHRMTPAAPAVYSSLGHASPESNVGRQAFSAPARAILDSSQSPQSPDLDVDHPLLSIPTGDLCCACDRTLTEPCMAEPHITSAEPAVSEAYVFMVDFLGQQPIVELVYYGAAAFSTAHPTPFVSPLPSWAPPL